MNAAFGSGESTIWTHCRTEPSLLNRFFICSPQLLEQDISSGLSTLQETDVLGKQA